MKASPFLLPAAAFLLHAASLAGAPPGAAADTSARPLVPCCVTLREQANLRALDELLSRSAATPAERGTAVLTVLRETASRTQEGILAWCAALPPGTIRSVRSFWIMNAVTCEAAPWVVEALAGREDVASVEAVPPGEPARALPTLPAPSTVPPGAEGGLRLINAHRMWERGFTGAGVLVMNLDTGVDWTHPALTSSWRGNSVPGAYAWFDPYQQTLAPVDLDGHGTSVMGIMVGADTSARDTIGVAPGAQWIAARTSFTTPQLLASLQWALDPDGNAATSDDRPVAVNNSWTQAPSSSCTGWGPLQALEAAGIAVIFPVGNTGPAQGLPAWPAKLNFSASHVMAVGAVDGGAPGLPRAPFSGRGPTPCDLGADRIKPELMAPGVDIRSAHLQGGYRYASGTDVAAPHLAGAIALLKQAFPARTGTELRDMLYRSARDLGPTGEENEYGMGLVDVERAWLENASLLDPRPPEGLFAYSDYISPTLISLAWTDPRFLVNGDTLTGFSIRIWRDGQPLVSVPAGNQYYADTGLTDGRLYEYVLRTERHQTGALSAPRSIARHAGGSPVPSPPSRLEASFSSGTALLRWIDPVTQADGTPLDDLAWILVYRDGALIDSVAPGAGLSADTPPNAGRSVFYTLCAADNETPPHLSVPTPRVSLFPGGLPDYLVWVGPEAGPSGAASGDSLFRALADAGASVHLTRNLFELGTSLLPFRAVFAVLGVDPYHHTLRKTAPEPYALDWYLLSGGALYLEGGGAFHTHPRQGAFDIRPWFGLSPSAAPVGGDVYRIAGRDTLAGFSFASAGPFHSQDPLVPLSSTVVWENPETGAACGVLGRTYGRGTALGVTSLFGGLLDSARTKRDLMAFYRALLESSAPQSFPPVLPGTLYAAGESLFTVDASTGSILERLGPLGRGVQGLAAHPVTRELYGIVPGDSGSFLCRIGSTGTPVSYLQALRLPSLRAITFDGSGNLWGGSTRGRLYRLDVASGDTAFVGSAQIVIRYGGLAFSPLSGSLWGSLKQAPFVNASIYRVSPQDGSVTLVGNSGGGDTPSLTFSEGGVLYGLKGSGSVMDTLIRIDTLSAAGTRIGPLGTSAVEAIAFWTVPPSAAGKPPPGVPVSGLILEPNYPNPFNAVSHFVFRLAEAGRIRLSICDLLGREVAVAAEGFRASGSHRVRWDASGLATGVYFCRLRAGSLHAVRKILILR
ncbi:MAG: S8 family serine peptidase [Bacteroidota bacterium]